MAAAAAQAAVTEDDLRELWTESGQSFNNFSVIKATVVNEFNSLR